MAAGTVQAEGHRRDCCGVPLQLDAWCAGTHIPYLRGPVKAAPDQPLTVGTKRQTGCQLGYLRRAADCRN